MMRGAATWVARRVRGWQMLCSWASRSWGVLGWNLDLWRGGLEDFGCTCGANLGWCSMGWATNGVPSPNGRSNTSGSPHVFFFDCRCNRGLGSRINSSSCGVLLLSRVFVGPGMHRRASAWQAKALSQSTSPPTPHPQARKPGPTLRLFCFCDL